MQKPSNLNRARREEETLSWATHSPNGTNILTVAQIHTGSLSPPPPPPSKKNQTRKQAAYSLPDAPRCTTQQVNCRVRGCAALVTSTRVRPESHEGVLFAAPWCSEQRRATSTFFAGARLVVSSVSYPNYKSTAPTSDSTTFVESSLASGWKTTNPVVFFLFCFDP